MQVAEPEPGALLEYRCVACKRRRPVADSDWTDDLPLYGDALARVSRPVLDRNRVWSEPVRIRFVDVPDSHPYQVELEARVPGDTANLTVALETLLDVAERIRGGDPNLHPEEWYLARDHARVTLNQWRGGGDDVSPEGCSATSSPSTVNA
jgi:hypothetical protein